MALLTVTCLLAVIFTTVYFFLKKRYNFWKSRGVMGPTPAPLLGNAGKVMLLKESHHDLAKRLYSDFPNEKIVGFFQGLTPALVIRDPELIKLVTVKDFDAFQNRGLKQSDERLEENLFVSEGETWKVLRHKLSPLYSSGKVKNMMPLMDQCVDSFLHHIDRLVSEGYTEQDIKKLSSLLMLDITGSCAFGIAMDLYKTKQNSYKEMADKIFTLPNVFAIRRFVEMLFPGFEHLLYKYFKVHGQYGYCSGYFQDLVKDIKEMRVGQVNSRNDFMDCLIDLKEKGQVEKREDGKVYADKMDDDLIAAQALIFFTVGFEPTSVAMSYLLFEIALNEDIQNKAYEEIRNVVEKHGKLTYESLSDMTYLEMVIDESLRKYSPTLFRKTNREYTFDDLDLTIPKNTPVLIPTNAIQMDPKYFEQPEVFDPERFSDENRKKIPSFAYMPFGAGPRHCIGTRLGRVQTLVGVASFLLKFRVFATPQTPKHQRDLKMDPRFISHRTTDGIPLGIARR